MNFIAKSAIIAVSAAILLRPPLHAAANMSTIQAAVREMTAGTAEDQAAALQRLFDLAGSNLGSPTVPVVPSGEPPDAGPLKRQMLQSLAFVESVFKTRYAPTLWKQEHAGWSLEAEFKRAKDEVRAAKNPTVKDFQRILRRVILSARDYHVNVRFAATDVAALPFAVQGVNGRYFITFIDRAKLPERTFPFKVGDELVGMDGRSAAQWVQELSGQLGGNTAQTDHALASLALTARAAAAGWEVPRGPVQLDIRRKGSGSAVSHQVIWDHSPELFKSQAASGDIPTRNIPMPQFNDALLPAGPELAATPPGNPFALGGRQSFVPPLGPKIWESDPKKDPFYAYIYRSPGAGKLMGYIRISSYSPTKKDQYNNAEAANLEYIKNFAAILTKFRDTTDGLVIDQVNNPGGSVFYLYTLASMLTDKSLYAPRHRMRITQGDVAAAAALLQKAQAVQTEKQAQKAFGKDFAGYPMSYELVRHLVEFSRFIISEWNVGRTLTQPYFLYGVDQINPSPAVQYAKPLLLLVNELDFSGGDFFPAIMQDNKRATLFGARTSGAGGYVNRVEYPNALGIGSFSLTGSIAVRRDGSPIENLGVKPDIEYALTEADFANEFKGYVEAVDKAVGRLF